MNTDTLADRAVMALSMVRSMTDGVTNDHPHRHVMMGMKRCAERVLADAFEVAIGLAFESQSVVDMAKSLTEQERERFLRAIESAKEENTGHKDYETYDDGFKDGCNACEAAVKGAA